MPEHPNIVSESNLPRITQSHGEGFASHRKLLGAAAGGRNLGCSLYEVPPGKKAWPRHYHLANEEAILILEGSGTLRIGGTETSVSAGDYAAFPPGEEYAHQLTNTSNATLRYICFSTMIEPEITVYPDSNKLGLFAGSAPGGPKDDRTLNTCLRADATVDYFESEE